MTTMMSPAEYHERVMELLAKPLFQCQHIGRSFLPGWLTLVEKLVADLEALPSGETLRCTQLKEKFGTLRCYLDGTGMRIDILGPGGASFVPEETDALLVSAQKLVLSAEQASATTCLFCGAPGVRRPGGWVYTACDEHVGARDLLEPYSAVIKELAEQQIWVD